MFRMVAFLLLIGMFGMAWADQIVIVSYLSRTVIDANRFIGVQCPDGYTATSGWFEFDLMHGEFTPGSSLFVPS